MLVYVDPDPEEIAQICKDSEFKVAKWIKVEDGSTIYWRAEDALHADVARLFQARNYDKGVAMEASSTVH
jgi:hypothetical protein